MDIKIKYGFDLNWFLSSYNKINYPESHLNFNQETREYIEYLYNIHYTNYDGFLDEILIHLKQKKKKQEFLKYEKRCIKCKCFYPYKLDSNIFIILNQNNTINDITNELCFNCIRHIIINQCNICKKKINDSCSQIYLKKLENNFTCSKCYQD